MKLLAKLWHGEPRATRFDTRLEKLARHRDAGRVDIQSRVLKTTTTARWWRRFR